MNDVTQQIDPTKQNLPLVPQHRPRHKFRLQSLIILILSKNQNNSIKSNAFQTTPTWLHLTSRPRKQYSNTPTHIRTYQPSLWRRYFRRCISILRSCIVCSRHRAGKSAGYNRKVSKPGLSYIGWCRSCRCNPRRTAAVFHDQRRNVFVWRSTGVCPPSCKFVSPKTKLCWLCIPTHAAVVRRYPPSRLNSECISANYCYRLDLPFYKLKWDNFTGIVSFPLTLNFRDHFRSVSLMYFCSNGGNCFLTLKFFL